MTHTDTQKLKEFITRNVKKALQADRKGYQLELWIYTQEQRAQGMVSVWECIGEFFHVFSVLTGHLMDGTVLYLDLSVSTSCLGF